MSLNPADFHHKMRNDKIQNPKHVGLTGTMVSMAIRTDRANEIGMIPATPVLNPSSAHASAVEPFQNTKVQPPRITSTKSNPIKTSLNNMRLLKRVMLLHSFNFLASPFPEICNREVTCSAWEEETVNLVEPNNV